MNGASFVSNAAAAFLWLGLFGGPVWIKRAAILDFWTEITQ